MSSPPHLCGILVRRAAEVPSELDWLSLRERATLGRLRVPARRADWLLGRWTAKHALSRCLAAADGRPALREIEIVAAEDGAPEALVRLVPAPCCISISHRAGLSLCAVSPGDVALGCDAERIEPHDDALAEDFFRAEEVAWVRNGAGRDRDLLVATIWSAKESALKLLRAGLRLDTRSVAVRLDTTCPVPCDWAPFEVRCDGRPQPLTGWWRRAGDDVFTVVTGRPSAPPRDLDLEAPCGSMGATALAAARPVE